jgi:hypothetical protein
MHAILHADALGVFTLLRLHLFLKEANAQVYHQTLCSY